jgi:LPXTG-motif cell wall-anchored protein
VPEVASSVPLTAPVDLIVDSPLPTTGPMTAGVAYWATALLVAGVGVVGAMRRRRDRTAMTDVGRYAE